MNDVVVDKLEDIPITTFESGLEFTLQKRIHELFIQSFAKLSAAS